MDDASDDTEDDDDDDEADDDDEPSDEWDELSCEVSASPGWCGEEAAAMGEIGGDMEVIGRALFCAVRIGDFLMAPDRVILLLDASSTVGG